MLRMCQVSSAFLVLTLAGCGCSLELFPDYDDDWDEYDAGTNMPDSGPGDAGWDAGPEEELDAAPPCRPERCSGRDDDCDGRVDEAVCTTLAAHVSVSGGIGERACAVSTDGRVACWGGRGLVAGDAIASGAVQPFPTFVDGVEDALEVGVGGYVSCAHTGSGVSCWASEPNDVGHWIPATPTTIDELVGASSLSVAHSNYCAVVGDSVVCSPNTAGPDPFFTPTFWTVALEGLPLAVSGSSHNTFVIRRDGTLVGWGLDYEGELGIGPTEGIIEEPQLVEGLGAVSDVCTGSNFSCAIHSGGWVACWGTLLGDGTTGASDVPVDGLISDAVSLTCGSGHACALRENGSAWCWGRNHESQLGNGTRDRAWSPVRVDLEGIVQIDAGYQTTCAVTEDGSAWCWGNNCHGAVGDGTTDGEVIRDGTCTRLRARPTRVLLP